MGVWWICVPAGAVFNFICGNRDEEVMAKIEQYFGSQVTEVIIVWHPLSSTLYSARLKFFKLKRFLMPDVRDINELPIYFSFYDLFFYILSK